MDPILYPRITVTPYQIRHAMHNVGLLSQFDGVLRLTGSQLALIYWDFSQQLDSDSPHFQNLEYQDDQQIYDAFVLAATL